MSQAFNLTAQLNLRGPSNIRQVVSDIRKQLGTVESTVKFTIDPSTISNTSKLSKSLQELNKNLSSVAGNAQAARDAIKSFGQSVNSISGSSAKLSANLAKNIKSSDNLGASVSKTAKNITVARTEMEEFGRQGALAIRRFAAFSAVTSVFFSLNRAINTGLKSFIEFDRQLVRLQQVTGKSAEGLRGLQDEITRLSVGLGVSSEKLVTISATLAQAGLSANETKVALQALARSELAPSFDDLNKTVEGSIALIRQFGIGAKDLEKALGSVNSVAARFAVESGDIIAAIQRTGGVFASASKGVSEGTDALNEFIAVFTSVRATTRESAETIATGLRTIFTRVQRSSTIEALREFGVTLTDAEGKFVGAYKAIELLSQGLNRIDPRDLRFSQIVEELGGFRQIGKVIPLIQQFATAQEALKVAQAGQGSLANDAVKAQLSLANQIAKVREEFLSLIRGLGQSDTFQTLAKGALGFASGLIKITSALKGVLPALAILGAGASLRGLTQFTSGFVGGLKKVPRGEGGEQQGVARSIGSNLGASLVGAKTEQVSRDLDQNSAALDKASGRLDNLTTSLNSLNSNFNSINSTLNSYNSLLQQSIASLNTNTSSLDNLTNAINNLNLGGGPTTVRDGGKILGFNKGGVVPGSGRGDKVPAMLEPGEVVMNNRAASKYGRGNLVRMNRYNYGGPINNLGGHMDSIVIEDASEAKIGLSNDNYQIKTNKKYIVIKNVDSSGNIEYEFGGKKSSVKSTEIEDHDRFEDVVADAINKKKTEPKYPIDYNATVADKTLYDAKFVQTPVSSRELAKKALQHQLYQTYGPLYDYEAKKTSLQTIVTSSKIIEGTNRPLTYGPDDIGSKQEITQIIPLFPEAGRGLATNSSSQTGIQLIKDEISLLGSSSSPYERKKIDTLKQDLYAMAVTPPQPISKLASQILDKNGIGPRQNSLTTLKSAGGPIQRFMAGSIGGVEEPSIDIEAYGEVGRIALRDKKPTQSMQEALNSSILTALSDLDGESGIRRRGVTIPQILQRRVRKDNIESGKVSSLEVAKLINQARLIDSQRKAQKRGLKHVGIAGLQPIDYNKDLQWQLDMGEDNPLNGEKYVAMIRGFSSQYLGDIERLRNRQRQISLDFGKDTTASEAIGLLGNKDVYGPPRPLVIDFDDTLSFGTKMIDPITKKEDIALYAMRDKVEQSLASATPTRLAERLAEIEKNSPGIIRQFTRVLTARPQTTEDLVSATLNRFGLPYQPDDVTGVGQGLGTNIAKAKADNLSVIERFIDDNEENIRAAKNKGIDSYRYQEPQAFDDSRMYTKTGEGNIEGALLEQALMQKLGYSIDINRLKGNRALDFPNGLGNAASLFGLPPNIETEVKRNLSGDRFEDSRNEFERYFRDNPNKFNSGGIVQRFMAGSVGGVMLGKGRGKEGARGARSKFRELDETELSKLSTKALIAYAKAQARDIFTTEGSGIAVANEFIEVPQERIIPELESELTTYLGKRGFWRKKIAPFGSTQPDKKPTQRKMDSRTLRRMTAAAGGVDASALKDVPLESLLKFAEQAPRAPKDVLAATQARYESDPEFVTSISGGLLKQWESKAKEKQFTTIQPLLDQLPQAKSLISNLRDSLVQQLEETKDADEKKSLQDQIRKATIALDDFDGYSTGSVPKNAGRASQFAWAMRQAIPDVKEYAYGGLVSSFNNGGKIQRFVRGGAPIKNSSDPVSRDKEWVKAEYASRTNEVTGDVFANKIGPDLYAVDTAGVSKPGQGYGVPLYDSVLQQVSAIKGWLTSSRTQVSEQARAIWDGYRKKRQDDVKNKLLPMEQWNMDPLFNGQIEGEPLNDLAYQFPENLNDLKKHKKTWPPKDHPVWSLQHAYQFKAKAIKKSIGGLVSSFKQIDLAKSLMPPRFALGGLADSTESMKSLMSGLYGNRQQQEEVKKQEKAFGKIGLRSSPSEITATYFKNKTREGFVSAKKSSGDLFTIGLSKATKGYGPRLYDVVMEAATSQGGMLTSDRSQVSEAARAVWAFYFKNRGDVKKTPLDPSQWTKNQNFIDPKLYGKKETWPPLTDEAWILQSGYSKSPDLINTPDVMDLNDPKYAAFIRQQQTSFLSQSSGGEISRFASGGTVPALVSNGEAYVPPKTAKRIGYSNLNRMNQADKNGMGRFSEGGISVFKGPGSGTSDSIPTSLPVGSFIIREKATKALGLNKGGSVGVQRFAKGGAAPGDFEANVQALLIDFEALIKATKLRTFSEQRAAGESLSAAKAAADTAASMELMSRANQKFIDSLDPKSGIDPKAINEALSRIRQDPSVTKLTPADIQSSRGPVSVSGAATVGTNLTTPLVDASIRAAEALDMMRLKAQQNGQTLSQYQNSLKQNIINLAKDLQKAVPQKISNFRQTTGDLTSKIRSGKEDDLSDAKDILSKQLANIAVDIKPEQLQKTIDDLVGSIQKGDQSFTDIINSSESLKQIFDEAASDTGALQQSLADISAATGIPIEALSRLANSADLASSNLYDKNLAAAQKFASSLAKTSLMIGGFSTALSSAMKMFGSEFSKSTATTSAAIEAFGTTVGTVGAAVSQLPSTFDSLKGLTQTGGMLANTPLAGPINQAAQGVVGLLANPFVLAGAGIGVAAVGLAAAFKEAHNAAREFEKQMASRNLENSLNKISTLFDEFSKDMSKKDILGDIKNELNTAISAAFVGIKLDATVPKMFWTNMIDAAMGGSDSAQRSMILEKQGMGAYLESSAFGQNPLGFITQGLTLGLGDSIVRGLSGGYLGLGVGEDSASSKQAARNREGYMFELAPQLAAQQSASLKPVADNVFKLFEQKLRTGSSIDDIMGELKDGTGVSQFASAIARSNPIIEEQIIKTQARADLDEVQKQQIIDGIIAREAEKQTILNNTAIMRQMELEKLNKGIVKFINSLERIYQNMEASINKASFEIQTLSASAELASSSLSGAAKAGSTNLSAVNILQNRRAYSPNEQTGAVDLASSFFGSASPAISAILNIGDKLETSILSTINRTRQAEPGATNERILASIRSNLDRTLSDLQIPDNLVPKLSNSIRDAFKDISTTGDKEVLNFEELAEKVPGLTKQIDAARRAQEVAVKALEFYQSQLTEYSNSMNSMIDLQMEANKDFAKASDILSNSVDELAKTFGREINLRDVINNTLAKTRRQTGGATDPTDITRNILNLENSRKILQGASDSAKAKGPSGKDEFQLMENRLRNTNLALRQNYDALKNLAENTDIASAALAKIQEIQQRRQAGANLIEKLVTSSPEELAKLNNAMGRLNNNMQGIANRGSTSEQRAESLQLFNQIAPLLGDGATQNALKANVLESQLLESGMGINPMFAQILDSLRNPEGDSEMQQAISVYEEGNKLQSEANTRLGELKELMAKNNAEVAAEKLKVAMTGAKLNFESVLLGDIKNEIINLKELVAKRAPAAAGLASGGVVYASAGQSIDFAPKGTDTVPAMLTPGEFVVNRRSTKANLPLLQNINSGKYNKGGKVNYLADGGIVPGDEWKTSISSAMTGSSGRETEDKETKEKFIKILNIPRATDAKQTALVPAITYASQTGKGEIPIDNPFQSDFLYDRYDIKPGIAKDILAKLQFSARGGIKGYKIYPQDRDPVVGTKVLFFDKLNDFFSDPDKPERLSEFDARQYKNKDMYNKILSTFFDSPAYSSDVVDDIKNLPKHSLQIKSQTNIPGAKNQGLAEEFSISNVSKSHPNKFFLLDLGTINSRERDAFGIASVSNTATEYFMNTKDFKNTSGNFVIPTHNTDSKATFGSGMYDVSNSKKIKEKLKLSKENLANIDIRSGKGLQETIESKNRKTNISLIEDLYNEKINVASFKKNDNIFNKDITLYNMDQAKWKNLVKLEAYKDLRDDLFSWDKLVDLYTFSGYDHSYKPKIDNDSMKKFVWSSFPSSMNDKEKALKEIIDGNVKLTDQKLFGELSGPIVYGKENSIEPFFTYRKITAGTRYDPFRRQFVGDPMNYYVIDKQGDNQSPFGEMNFSKLFIPEDRWQNFEEELKQKTDLSPVKIPMATNAFRYVFDGAKGMGGFNALTDVGDQYNTILKDFLPYIVPNTINDVNIDAIKFEEILRKRAAETEENKALDSAKKGFRTKLETTEKFTNAKKVGVARAIYDIGKDKLGLTSKKPESLNDLSSILGEIGSKQASISKNFDKAAPDQRLSNPQWLLHEAYRAFFTELYKGQYKGTDTDTPQFLKSLGLPIDNSDFKDGENPVPVAGMRGRTESGYKDYNAGSMAKATTAINNIINREIALKSGVRFAGSLDEETAATAKISAGSARIKNVANTEDIIPKSYEQMAEIGLNPTNVFSTKDFRSENYLDPIKELFDKGTDDKGNLVFTGGDEILSKSMATIINWYKTHQDRLLNLGLDKDVLKTNEEELKKSDSLSSKENKDLWPEANVAHNIVTGNNYGNLPQPLELSSLITRELKEPIEPVNRARGGLIYASAGQLVNFQPKGTDTVPAMLTPGEFVVNRSATQKNLPLLKSINSGTYSKGGVVYLEQGGTTTGVRTQSFSPGSNDDEIIMAIDDNGKKIDYQKRILQINTSTTNSILKEGFANNQQLLSDILVLTAVGDGTSTNPALNRAIETFKSRIEAAFSLSTGGLIYASTGQLVNYQPRGTDTVPAMLTPGEFVVNRAATERNLPLLQSINSGNYSDGGVVYLADGGSPKDRAKKRAKMGVVPPISEDDALNILKIEIDNGNLFLKPIYDRFKGIVAEGNSGPGWNNRVNALGETRITNLSLDALRDFIETDNMIDTDGKKILKGEIRESAVKAGLRKLLDSGEKYSLDDLSLKWDAVFDKWAEQRDKYLKAFDTIWNPSQIIIKNLKGRNVEWIRNFIDQLNITPEEDPTTFNKVNKLLSIEPKRLSTKNYLALGGIKPHGNQLDNLNEYYNTSRDKLNSTISDALGEFDRYDAWTDKFYGLPGRGRHGSRPHRVYDLTGGSSWLNIMNGRTTPFKTENNSPIIDFHKDGTFLTYDEYLSHQKLLRDVGTLAAPLRAFPRSKEDRKNQMDQERVMMERLGLPVEDAYPIDQMPIIPPEVAPSEYSDGPGPYFTFRVGERTVRILNPFTQGTTLNQSLVDDEVLGKVTPRETREASEGPLQSTTTQLTVREIYKRKKQEAERTGIPSNMPPAAALPASELTFVEDIIFGSQARKFVRVTENNWMEQRKQEMMERQAASADERLKKQIAEELGYTTSPRKEAQGDRLIGTLAAKDWATKNYKDLIDEQVEIKETMDNGKPNTDTLKKLVQLYQDKGYDPNPYLETTKKVPVTEKGHLLEYNKESKQFKIQDTGEIYGDRVIFERRRVVPNLDDPTTINPMAIGDLIKNYPIDSQKPLRRWKIEPGNIQQMTDEHLLEAAIGYYWRSGRNLEEQDVIDEFNRRKGNNTESKDSSRASDLLLADTQSREEQKNKKEEITSFKQNILNTRRKLVDSINIEQSVIDFLSSGGRSKSKNEGIGLDFSPTEDWESWKNQQYSNFTKYFAGLKSFSQNSGGQRDNAINALSELAGQAFLKYLSIFANGKDISNDTVISSSKQQKTIFIDYLDKLDNKLAQSGAGIAGSLKKKGRLGWADVERIKMEAKAEAQSSMKPFEPVDTDWETEVKDPVTKTSVLIPARDIQEKYQGLPTKRSFDDIFKEKTKDYILPWENEDRQTGRSTYGDNIKLSGYGGIGDKITEDPLRSETLQIIQEIEGLIEGYRKRAMSSSSGQSFRDQEALANSVLENSFGDTTKFSTGGVVYASNGTLVPYQPRGTDTVPAMLTPGEFVVNRAATQRNLPLLKSINSGNYSDGGVVYAQNGRRIETDPTMDIVSKSQQKDAYKKRTTNKLLERELYRIHSSPFGQNNAVHPTVKSVTKALLDKNPKQLDTLARKFPEIMEEKLRIEKDRTLTRDLLMDSSGPFPSPSTRYADGGVVYLANGSDNAIGATSKSSSRLWLKGHLINNQPLVGAIVDVNSNGEPLIRTGSGRSIRLDSGIWNRKSTPEDKMALSSFLNPSQTIVPPTTSADSPSQKPLERLPEAKPVVSSQTPRNTEGKTPSEAMSESSILRLWTDNTGQFATTGKLDYFDEAGTVGIIKSNGKSISVKLDRLSSVNQDYVRSQKWATERYREIANKQAIDEELKSMRQVAESEGSALDNMWRDIEREQMERQMERQMDQLSSQVSLGPDADIPLPKLQGSEIRITTSGGEKTIQNLVRNKIIEKVYELEKRGGLIISPDILLNGGSLGDRGPSRSGVLNDILSLFPTNALASDYKEKSLEEIQAIIDSDIQKKLKDWQEIFNQSQIATRREREEKQYSTMLDAAVFGVATNILPSIGASIGAVGGGIAGLPLGPGAGIMAFGTGVVAGAATSEAQNAFLDRFFPNFQERRRELAEAHPWITLAADLAPLGPPVKAAGMMTQPSKKTPLPPPKRGPKVDPKDPKLASFLQNQEPTNRIDPRSVKIKSPEQKAAEAAEKARRDQTAQQAAEKARRDQTAQQAAEKARRDQTAQQASAGILRTKDELVSKLSNKQATIYDILGTKQGVALTPEDASKLLKEGRKFLHPDRNVDESALYNTYFQKWTKAIELGQSKGFLRQYDGALKLGFDPEFLFEIARESRSRPGSKILDIKQLIFKRPDLEKQIRTLSMGGIVYANNGMLIPYQPRGTDTVPAMLTPGEFVINRASTQKYKPVLEAINNGNYSRGGIVNYLKNGGYIAPSYFQEAGSVGPRNPIESFDFTKYMSSLTNSLISTITTAFDKALSDIKQPNNSSGGVSKDNADLASIDNFVNRLNNIANILSNIYIPPQITITGKHDVVVTINGDTVLNQLRPDIAGIVVSAIKGAFRDLKAKNPENNTINFDIDIDPSSLQE